MDCEYLSMKMIISHMLNVGGIYFDMCIWVVASIFFSVPLLSTQMPDHPKLHLQRTCLLSFALLLFSV